MPVLLSTANVSGLEWAKVDGSALVAAQNTATLQVALLRLCSHHTIHLLAFA